MSGLNRSILAGIVVNDPDIRYTKDEITFAYFSIKTPGATDNIRCSASGGLAKICGEYLKKGRMVAVEGRLQIKSHKNKLGRIVGHAYIIVDNLQMLDSKFYNATKKGGE